MITILSKINFKSKFLAFKLATAVIKLEPCGSQEDLNPKASSHLVHKPLDARRNVNT